MTKEQEQEITDYLILHKLPLDILLEVKDHMVTQVSDIQMHDNLDFDKALLKAQKLWADEFKMTRYSVFFNEKIPMIVKRIVKEKYNNIMKKALFFGMLSFAVNILLIYLSADQEVYTDLFRLYNSCFVLAPFLCWVFNSKMRKYVRQDFKYQGKLFYTIYQHNLALWIICINFMFQVVIRENAHAFNFFRTDNQIALFPFMVTLLIPLVLHMIVVFTLINFFEHKKTLHKMRNFLNQTIE